MSTLEQIQAKAAPFVALRHDLHRHPELGLQEFRTSDLLAEQLQGWGYRVTRGLATTGLVAQLRRGSGRTRLGLRLKLSPAQHDHLASDAKGDRLDAVLCLLQAGWADLQREAGDPRCGLPPGMDPVEGWILTA